MSAVSGSYLHHCSVSKTAHLELLRSNFVRLQQGICAYFTQALSQQPYNARQGLTLVMAAVSRSSGR